MEQTDNTIPKKKGFLRRLVGFILWFAGIWAALLLLLQIVLSESVLTRIVNRIGADYVDGNLSFGKASVNMFSRFPNVSLSLDDVSITYPADRFDALEQAGAQGELMYQGTGEAADTLAAFERFSVSINLAALATGSINIPHMRLTGPRIFAHSYDDENANWKMFRFASSEEEEDTTGLKRLPRIVLGRISLAGKPHVVYTDSRDTLFSMINIGRASFNGRLNSRVSSRNRIGLSLDSIFIAGRMASDTLAFRLDQLHLHEHNDHVDVDIAANAMLLTRGYGRLNIPISAKGTAGMHRDSIPVFHIEGMKVSVAGIPADMDIRLTLDKGRTGVEGFVEVAGYHLDGLIRDYVSGLIPETAGLSTDATLNLMATCEGDYIHSTGRLPSFSAVLSIPEAAVSHSGYGLALNVGIEAEASNDSRDRISLDITRATARTTGLNLDARASIADMLGPDPTFDIDGTLSAALDTLSSFLPDTLGISADGEVQARLQGKAKMSQLDMYNFFTADLSGELSSGHLSFNAARDTLNATVNGLNIRISPENVTSRRDSSQTFRLIGLSARIDDADISYKEAMRVKGKTLAFTVKNTTDQAALTDSSKFNRIGGRLSAETLTLKDAASTTLGLSGTNNSFQLIPKPGSDDIPLLSLTSRNKRILFVSKTNRAMLADSRIKANAAMNSIARKRQREARLDSLAAIYPDVPRDSLMSKARRDRSNRGRSTQLFEEDDFQDSNIDIRLDETLAKYFREWDLDGSIDVRSGFVTTPYFPLRNTLKRFAASFNNDRVAIDSLKVVSGRSEISGRGHVSGLRRALGGRGRGTSVINADMEISSTRMNANEILKAYNAGMNFNPASMKINLEASDEEFLEQVTSDTTAVDDAAALIVIPSNINAGIRLNAENITYSDLEISLMTADLKVKDHCVQITNTHAYTNMGEIGFDGFYATRSKTEIQAGFDFMLKDITADKVISLMPAVDTIMPLLKSFNGLLNCEVAATASLDTAMNIIMPSIDGVVRIEGRDLALTGDKTINSITRLLKFKNMDEARIDAMMVEGRVKDNTLEVFPFLLDIDRYSLALSGVQNLDMSFRYHISMLRSPLLFRFGVDLYGDDFDNMKFKIGKAKYKNANIPVFSEEIDEIRLNLSESIRNIFEKGVDKAIRDHKAMETIDEYKKDIGYVEAVDMEIEALSKEEENELLKEEETYE